MSDKSLIYVTRNKRTVTEMRFKTVTYKAIREGKLKPVRLLSQAAFSEAYQRKFSTWHN